MRTRIFAFTAITVLLLNIAAFARPDTRRKTAKQRQTARLVATLPASDAVAVFDSKRFFGDALPKILSSNQPVLAEITAKLNEMESRTGLDLRKFEQVAVGVAFKQVSAKEIDFEPVAIASGDINTGALIAIAKFASKGTYRTQTIAGRTVYIFSAKDVIQKTTAKQANSKIADMLDKGLNGMTKDVAVTAYDRNTLVMGSLARVTETLEGKSKIAAEVSSLLSQKETSVMSFAARTPGTMSKLLPLDNDEFGNNIDAIQFLSGSVDVAAAGTSLSMLAKTRKAEQATGLKDMLDVLQTLGKSIFGNSKRPDQQVYGRLIKNAKFEAHGNDVSFDLMIQQSDIDALIGRIK